MKLQINRLHTTLTTRSEQWGLHGHGLACQTYKGDCWWFKPVGTLLIEPVTPLMMYVMPDYCSKDVILFIRRHSTPGDFY